MTELSTPPDREVEWEFRFVLRVRQEKRPGAQWVRIWARSWFAARDLAAAALGVGRDEVEVVR